MRHSKLVFTFIAVTITTWLVVGAIVYFLSDDISYKSILRDTGMLVFMLIFGWLPAIPVCIDLDERL